MEHRSSRIEKPWGYEELVEHNERYVVKKLFMKRGHQCSLQFHNYKKETVMVLEGSLKVIYNDDVVELGPFQSMTISPKEVHRMIAEAGDCLYMECSTPELDDVVRIQDSYGR